MYYMRQALENEKIAIQLFQQLFMITNTARALGNRKDVEEFVRMQKEFITDINELQDIIFIHDMMHDPDDDTISLLIDATNQIIADIYDVKEILNLDTSD